MPESQEQRHAYYDYDLKIEAYNLSGIVQKFPNHFHEYYVVGFIEGGKRHLCCKGQEYDVGAGDLILFNPRDNHYCGPINGEILDYRAINIPSDTFLNDVKEITGKEFIPYFNQNVVYQSDIAPLVNDVYNTILMKDAKMKKEEAYFFLLEQLLQEYVIPFDETVSIEPNEQLKELCTYMEEHFSENITLDDLLTMTSFGKSYLLRSFTKQIGVSPYRYLQTTRIQEAKKLLEQGYPLIDIANMTGFTDQSHFTNAFKEFIGLTPKQYQNIFIDASQGDSNEN